jgi:hypothetical protein
VPCGEVLVPPGERALDRPPRLAGEVGGDPGVVVRGVLRAEPAAHEPADDAYVVRRQLVVLGDLLADPPDVLRRDVDRQPVARLPFANRLVGLHRVVEDALSAVLRLHDDVGFGETSLDVPALGDPRVADERVAGDRLVGVEQRLELLPVDLDQRESGLCLGEGVGSDGGDGLPRIADLLEDRAEDAANAGRLPRGVEVEAANPRMRVRTAQDGRVEHSGQLDVGRVPRLAPGSLQPVEPCRRAADRVARPLGPLLERVLLDDDPRLGVAALDFLLGLDQPRHEAIASSIFG